MIPPLWVLLISLAAAFAAIGLGILLLSRHRPSVLRRNVACVLIATALVYFANGLVLLDRNRAPLWRHLALLGELLQAAATLYVALAVTKAATPSVERETRWRAHTVLLLAALLGIFAFFHRVFAIVSPEASLTSLGLSPLGRVMYVLILLVMAFGLASIEQVLRGASDPIRLQLKFILIGVGGLAGYQIYQSSQLLLLPVWQSHYAFVGGLTTLISLSLIAYGFGQSRLEELSTKVYVSSQVLSGTVAFLAVGLYLLSVGVTAELMRQTGQPLDVALSGVLVFGAVIALALSLLSRRMRARLRRFISRHFSRSKYDYRAKWIEVTEAFRAAASVETILDKLLAVLSRTFGASRISIWMGCEADRRFYQVRALNFETAPPPIPSSHPVVAGLLSADGPLALAAMMRPDAISDSPDLQAFLEATHAVLCVPIRSERELIAFVAVSHELHGEGYGTEDCDLLRAISHHVGVLLSHARLAEERRAATELEAMHRFSAFCLHDLKNLTGRLSLVVQNAEVHGEDPAFWQTAMRTVSSTIQRMIALMTKLDARRTEGPVSEVVDVHDLIAEMLASTDGMIGVPVRAVDDPVPPVRIARDQFHQVLLNLLLNAGQAILGSRQGAGDVRGEIQISTRQVNGSVVVTVADNGPGIPAARLQTLFQPFQSTKVGGLGIGLFQCKRIIEAHHGTIWVESQVGRGTSVRIELPISQPGTGGTAKIKTNATRINRKMTV